MIRRDVRHTPRVVVHRPVIYTAPRDYYMRVNRIHIYRRWIQEPVIFTYSDGYWDIDGYPYYVDHGYRYRYNPVEMCQYELVDGESYETVTRYPVMACTTAYDTCAAARDNLNVTSGSERFFCAEAVDEDLQVNEAEQGEYQSSPVDMTPSRIAAIEAFLQGKSFKQLFDEGPVGKCAIYKIGGAFSSGNKFGCRYIVKVNQDAYPLVDQSVCSEDSAAALIGCNVGTEKENAGCILQEAVLAGYCI